MPTIRQVVLATRNPNGDDDLDEVDQALYRYVREIPVLSEGWTDDLIERYPLTAPVTLYRGLMFDTEEQMANFMGAIDDGYLKTTRLSSWARDKATSFQFAATKPSFGITKDLSDRGKKNPGEVLMGKGGIILKTHVSAGSGIDLQHFRYRAEDEVLLVPGRYRVEVIKVIRQFKEMVGGQDVNKLLRDLVANHGWEKLLQNGETIEGYETGGLFRYITQQHLDSLTKDSRMLMAKILGRGKITSEYAVQVGRNPLDGLNKVEVSIGVSLGMLAAGFFGTPTEARKLKEARPLLKGLDVLVDEVVAAIRANPTSTLVFYGGSNSKLYGLVKYASPGAQQKYKKVLQEVFGQRYNELGRSRPQNEQEMKKLIEDLMKTIRSISAAGPRTLRQVMVAAVDREGNDIVDHDGRLLPLNSDGTLTLYHRTTQAAADAIHQTGQFKSAHNTDEVWFSTVRDGNAVGHGDVVVTVRVPARHVRLEDTFPSGEVYVAVLKNRLSKRNLVTP